MKSYVWLTFAFLGWGYYEISGGADFEPEVRAAVQTEAAPVEVVARADTTTLLSVSASNTVPNAADASANIGAIAQEDAQIEQAVAAARVLDTVEAAVDSVETPAVEAAITPEPQIDIREVAGSRVNMRMGPGTGFDVITTLDGGTKLEVLEVNADGWANVSTVDRGIEGWMAERLLTDANT